MTRRGLVSRAARVRVTGASFLCVPACRSACCVRRAVCGARPGVPAAGSAFRRRGEVGEVVEELRGLSKAGDEVLVEDDFGGVVECVLGQALAVVAALPGVPQGVGAGDEWNDHGEEDVCHVRAIGQRGGTAMDALVVGAAVRDDDGGLVPDLAPDSGGGVGVGAAGPAREVVRRDGGVDVDPSGTRGEVPEGGPVGPPGALELDPAVPLVVDRGGGPVVQRRRPVISAGPAQILMPSSTSRTSPTGAWGGMTIRPLALRSVTSRPVSSATTTCWTPEESTGKVNRQPAGPRDRRRWGRRSSRIPCAGRRHRWVRRSSRRR